MEQQTLNQIKISPKKEINNVLGLKEKVGKVIEVSSVTKILEVILEGAISLTASDVHIEPQEKKIRLRIRVDGILQDVLDFPLKNYETILSRIKLLSGIKINVSDRPQDGRFTIILGEAPIEIRTSTLPAEYGESIVLRILNPKSLIGIEELGLREDLLKVIKKEIKRPNGMIIVTGPTGSGKTTTLYAFLKGIKKPEIKIITIEDPIEYRLKGVSQTQVHPKKGYDFASGLKAIVRQDPDIILVGEIRDEKTAKISIQAALTGHLVFTTLHTNDASGTIARLNNLGAVPSNIGSALNIAVAQRLIRMICKKCSKPEKISSEDLKKIKEGLKTLPKSIKIPEINTSIKILRAKGCKDCNNTGYWGQIGIFEILLIDDEMETFILSNPSIAALRKETQKRGMTSLKEDGLIRVLEKMTTIEEVERVLG
ncbi:MAG TPA: GspE/PulE family protein [Candidatus Parcubacteria bacterium]|nr:GspE/PulE family protein [Candidatus Parcubacteria bacterium]|tara:strand:+ start:303 stop:1583 length:1281 start_codon:yes stop_codon:yes gene_type:complete